MINSTKLVEVAQKALHDGYLFSDFEIIFTPINDFKIIFSSINDLGIKFYPLSDLTTLWFSCRLAIQLFHLNGKFSGMDQILVTLLLVMSLKYLTYGILSHLDHYHQHNCYNRPPF